MIRKLFTENGKLKDIVARALSSQRCARVFLNHPLTNHHTICLRPSASSTLAKPAAAGSTNCRGVLHALMEVTEVTTKLNQDVTIELHMILRNLALVQS